MKADTRDYPRAARVLALGGGFHLNTALDCITQLGGTLTLLGELEPIARQLFVAPFAFFLPATIGKLSTFCRVRTESFRLAVRRLNLARRIAGGEEIHGHGDLHHFPPCPLEISTVVTLACDCDHKNAFFHRWSGVAPSSAKFMFLERVRGELSGR